MMILKKNQSVILLDRIVSKRRAWSANSWSCYMMGTVETKDQKEIQTFK
jgi:hypothetical protein